MSGNSYVTITQEEEAIAKIIVNAAYNVHKQLGPGLLEKFYELCLAHELSENGLEVKRQVQIPVRYKTVEFEDGLRLDLLIENKIICEVKAMEHVHPVWEAQILSQLKLTGLHLGFLINFHVPLIKNGIKRYIAKKTIP